MINDLFAGMALLYLAIALPFVFIEAMYFDDFNPPHGDRG